MKLIISSFVTFFLCIGFISDQPNKELQFISFPQFEEMTNEKSDKIRIFNFWATWCAPCVKEMPFFQKVKEEDPKLDLIFISMDDGRKPERVTTFMERRNVSSPVYLLNDVDYNKWIDKVDPSWSGAIPATLFVKPDGSRFFHEGEVTEEELKEMIKQLK